MDSRFGQSIHAGNQDVRYDDDGRLIHDRNNSHFSWKRTDETLTYDPRENKSRDAYGYEFARDTPRSSGRTYESEGPLARPVIIPPPPPPPVIPTRKYVKDRALYVEERIVSHEQPWIWPLFLIVALLMFGAGIFNYLVCVDHFFYSLFWGPLFLIVFVIFGALHKGIYLHKSGGKWRNRSYIIFGILASIVMLFCCAVVQIRLNHVTIQITEYGASGFILYEIDRMNVHKEFPRMNLSSESYEMNIWACYSTDWVALILTCIAFAVVPSVIVIANNYYNSNHSYTREVEPFCRPALFNPWGQVSAAQAMAFMGIVLKTSAHGNFKVRYQDYWIPVWAAIFPVAAAIFTAISLKRIGLRHGRLLVAMAILFELLTLLIMAVGVGLNTFALYENILSLSPGPIAVTEYSNQLLTSSIIIFVLMDILLLVGLVYSLALLVRLFMEGCNTARARRYQEEHYGEEKVEVGTKVTQDVVPAYGGGGYMQRF